MPLDKSDLLFFTFHATLRATDSSAKLYFYVDGTYRYSHWKDEQYSYWRLEKDKDKIEHLMFCHSDEMENDPPWSPFNLDEQLAPEVASAFAVWKILHET